MKILLLDPNLFEILELVKKPISGIKYLRNGWLLYNRYLFSYFIIFSLNFEYYFKFTTIVIWFTLNI